MPATKVTRSLIQARAYSAIASDNPIIRRSGAKVLLMNQQSLSIRLIVQTAHWDLIS